MRVQLERLQGDPASSRVEIVERKGLGHPDTICDAVAEQLGLALSRAYLEHAGTILHHNVDKALLVGGASTPRFGGGRIDAPMELILAGRATGRLPNQEIPVGALAVETARQWFRDHLPEVDPMVHLEVRSRIRAGSADLRALFEAGGDAAPCANDTSCGVGWAPLSETESLTYGLERFLTGELRSREPWVGSDVKVMAVREDARLSLTVACAMIDRTLEGPADYCKRRAELEDAARRFVEARSALELRLFVNAADDDRKGRFYLTVTGTSAEAGDDGQAGRGNRVNGLICPGRPMTMESVAGKNPVTHVGKLYNLAASGVAARLVDRVPGVAAAECRLVSRIGDPIDRPLLSEVRVRGADPEDPQVARAVEEQVALELAELRQSWRLLLSGELAVDRWPLRTSGAEPA